MSTSGGSGPGDAQAFTGTLLGGPAAAEVASLPGAVSAAPDPDADPFHTSGGGATRRVPRGGRKSGKSGSAPDDGLPAPLFAGAGTGPLVSPSGAMGPQGGDHADGRSPGTEFPGTEFPGTEFPGTGAIPAPGHGGRAGRKGKRGGPKTSAAGIPLVSAGGPPASPRLGLNAAAALPVLADESGDASRSLVRAHGGLLGADLDVDLTRTPPRGTTRRTTPADGFTAAPTPAPRPAPRPDDSADDFNATVAVRRRRARRDAEPAAGTGEQARATAEPVRPVDRSDTDQPFSTIGDGLPRSGGTELGGPALGGSLLGGPAFGDRGDDDPNPAFPSSMADPAEPAPRKSRAGRNLTAAIMVGVGLGGAVAASLFIRKEAFVALASAAIVLGVWELAGAFSTRKITIPVIPLAVGSVGMLVSAFVADEEGLLVAFALTAFGAMLWRIIDGLADAARDVAAAVFTAAYVPFLAGFAMLMLAERDGAKRIVVFILLVVANDVGGYATGVLVGRHPMAPSVSPKKSWEGFGGSLVTGMAVGAVAVALLLGGPWWAGVAVGAAAVVTATLGDLSESLLKRDLGIKDMGNLLPGHGGIMDRLDSLLPTAPAVYLLLELLVTAR